jgi:hypothetical protein
MAVGDAGLGRGEPADPRIDVLANNAGGVSAG